MATMVCELWTYFGASLGQVAHNSTVPDVTWNEAAKSLLTSCVPKVISVTHREGIITQQECHIRQQFQPQCHHLDQLGNRRKRGQDQCWSCV